MDARWSNVLVETPETALGRKGMGGGWSR
jgi:hypothetical protein